MDKDKIQRLRRVLVNMDGEQEIQVAHTYWQPADLLKVVELALEATEKASSKMTVKELREILRRMPEDWQVVYFDDGDLTRVTEAVEDGDGYVLLLGQGIDL